jgi:hypothetical protein
MEQSLAGAEKHSVFERLPGDGCLEAAAGNLSYYLCKPSTVTYEAASVVAGLVQQSLAQRYQGSKLVLYGSQVRRRVSCTIRGTVALRDEQL